MIRIRMIGLALVAVFAFSAVAAASASANHVWWVKGEPLAEGTGINRALKAEAVAPGFELEGTIFGVNGKVECKKIKFGATPAAIIFNKEKTGRDEGKIEFTECKGPAICGKITEPIVTSGTETELVANVVEGKEGKKIYDLFKPKAGAEELAAEIHFAICGTLKIKGSTAAEISPEGESVVKDFIFPKPAIKEVWKWSASAPTKIGLTSEGNPAGFFGTAKVELTTGEMWDVK
jgi:hypothetical protein